MDATGCHDDKNLHKIAKPSSPFPINSRDLQEISQQVHQRIFELEALQVSSQAGPKQPFALEHTENLVGDFQKEVQRFKGNPKLFELLLKYEPVFGPLPPPGQGCKLVEMDIEIKGEFLDKPLRGKCWPMSKADSDEIEKQVEELLEACQSKRFHSEPIQSIALQHFGR